MKENRVASLRMRLENIPEPTIYKDSKGWEKFGNDNKYPEFLYDCYKNCSLLKSIIDGFCFYIYGNGIDIEDKVVNKRGEYFSSIIKRCINDYLIFGSFSLQVLRNSFGKINEIYYIDVRNIRLGNEENEDYFYYSELKKPNCKRIRYSLNNDKETTSIYYFKNYLSKEKYGLPLFSSSIKSIQTYIEIVNFHLQNVRNCFTPATLINFNDGKPDDETMKNMQRAFENRFTGTDNASRIMLTFSDSKENGVEVNKISDDSYDDKYLTLMDNVITNIYTSFRAQPILFGINPEKTSFNSIEYKESFSLFNNTVIKPLQKEISKFFGNLGFDFSFYEFNLDF